MKALVIFESMYGNTHVVAEQIAEGLESGGEVAIRVPAQVEPSDLEECDLIVVGGPTHVHGMSSARSREAAAATAADDPDLELDEAAGGPGLKQLIDGLPVMKGLAAAAFDTRIDKPVIVTGSAARRISRRLRRRGFKPIAEAESFLVADATGPLVEGEAVRARQWGEVLAARFYDHRA